MRRRLVSYRRWFAWRPVFTTNAGWRWLTQLERKRWSYIAGDFYFEGFTYALLP